MLGSTLCAALLSLASATVLLKPQVVSEKTVTKHTLRVCNAYPSSHDLRLLKNSKELKGKSQMKYKECIEVDGPLKEGDQLNFEAGLVPLGTFTVSELPEEKSTLILVAFRESKVNTKIAFMSHTFQAGAFAQLAVIDAFQGKTMSNLVISQLQDPNNTGAALSVKDQEMKLNSAMEVEAGVYQVKMSNGATSQTAGPFVVAKGENYVLLRTGLDDAPSPPPPSSPQETQKSSTDTSATGGEGLFKDPANAASLMAVHTAQQRSQRDEGVATTGGEDFFSPSPTKLNLLAEHTGTAGSGTSGPGTSFHLIPDIQEPPATGGLTEGAERGETLEQFLGLVSEPVYPQEFVVYPLLKPLLTEKKQEQEHSGASAVGPTAVLLAVAVLSALLA